MSFYKTSHDKYTAASVADSENLAKPPPRTRASLSLDSDLSLDYGLYGKTVLKGL